jgi:hypothetical protein
MTGLLYSGLGDHAATVLIYYDPSKLWAVARCSRHLVAFLFSFFAVSVLPEALVTKV